MTANRIIQHIFQEPDIRQVDESSIDRLISTYPYFTAARLLLAKKQYSEQRNLLAPAVKKAQQFSNNMHYFYRFVTTDEVVAQPQEETIPEPAPVTEAFTFPEPAQEVMDVSADNVTVEPVASAPIIETQTPTIEEPAPIVEEPIFIAQEAPSITAPATPEEGPIRIFPLDMPALENDTLTFQPLYSDDYFAYKRLQEPEKADELNEKGRAEMKSFTAWLKDMKSSFAEKATKQWYHQQMHMSYQDADPEVSEQVEKMAMESITLNNDIVSETLAEIWARQHQYQTAILIYQKLSLLNPGKSAYFAQKIKELQSLTDKN